MAKKYQDRFTVLAPDLASPRIIANIDKALEENQRERTELIRLREMAVDRHGDIGTRKTASPDASTALQTNQSAEREQLSVATLIGLYKTNKESGFSELRFRTRQHYESLMRRIARDLGPELIRDIDTNRLKRAHEVWTRSGIAMAHALVVMLRGLAAFGTTALKSKECRELKYTISEAKFQPAKPRGERLSAKQVEAIISKAHQMDLRSIALAQAFQFDCGLHQRDVIGEWVPETEPGESHLPHHGGMKWLRGIRWEEIDENLVLHHTPSRGGKTVEIPLADTATVMHVLRGQVRPTKGPVIVFEKSGRPYLGHQFRVTWREVADAAGIPKNIKNMDSK
jgi:hypothetical protein